METSEERVSAGSRLRASAWLLPPLAVGAALRLWNLGAQVLGDDEMHLVRTALGNPLSSILVTYQRVDNSIPMTALFRFLMDRGVLLTEWLLRLPGLVAGFAALALFPLLAARRLAGRARSVAIVFAWLLALSPGLVFYTRIARTYLPMVFLGGVAVAAFEAWWRTGRRRWAALYVVCAALATWLHLGAATFVVAPFLFAGGDALLRRDLRGFLRAVVLGLATVAAFLAFLIPAWESLVALVVDKHQPLRVTMSELKAVARLQAGTAFWPATALFWLAAAVGLARLFREDRRLAAFSATVVLGHVAGLLVLSPVGHEAPLVLNRYLLVSLPIVLLWIAVALAPSAGGSRWRSEGWAGWTVPATFLALVTATGPFMDAKLWRSSFAHGDDHLAFYTPRAVVAPRRIPAFYRRLAAEPDGGAVLEFPWLPVWRVNRAFYVYQEVHGRQVVVAPPHEQLWNERLAFRNMVPGRPADLLASRARWLIIHRDLGREEDRTRDAVVYHPLRIGVIQRHTRRRFWRLFHNSARATVAQLKMEWGPPDHAERAVVVWDLDRVRRERASR